MRLNKTNSPQIVLGTRANVKFLGWPVQFKRMGWLGGERVYLIEPKTHPSSTMRLNKTNSPQIVLGTRANVKFLGWPVQFKRMGWLGGSSARIKQAQLTRGSGC